MKHVLVPIDFSKISTQLVERAGELAKADGSKVTIIHVVESDTEPASYEAGPQSVRDRRSMEFHETHQRLQEYSEHLKQSGVETTALLVEGDIAQQILEHAKKFQSEVIVLGRHGHSGLLSKLLGTVSETVLHKSPCPVLLVPVT